MRRGKICRVGSLSWTGMGEYTVRVGRWEVGRLARRRVGEGSGLRERTSTEKEGCALCCHSWGAWEAWWDHQRGSCRTKRCLEYPDLQSRLHSTVVAVRPWSPYQFLVESSCHLRPWPQDLGALWLSLPSALSQAVSLRDFSPHFIRRVTQARVHII